MNCELLNYHIDSGHIDTYDISTILLWAFGIDYGYKFYMEYPLDVINIYSKHMKKRFLVGRNDLQNIVDDFIKRQNITQDSILKGLNFNGGPSHTWISSAMHPDLSSRFYGYFIEELSKKASKVVNF